MAHDITIANVLRFLGYYDMWGYQKKAIGFGSSLRVELLREINKSFADSDEKGDPMRSRYFLRFVFDGEVIQLPFCRLSSPNLCRFSEFNNHLKKKGMLSRVKS